MPDVLYWIPANRKALVQPVKEHFEVAGIVIDCADAYLLAVVPPPLRVIYQLLGVLHIGGIFPPLVQIGNVTPYNVFCDLIDILNVVFLFAPPLEQPQGLFVGHQGFGSELLALAEDHEFINLPIKR